MGPLRKEKVPPRPDFATVYQDDANVSPRMAARFWETAEGLADHSEFDEGEQLSWMLPRIARLHSDADFLARLVDRLRVLASRIAKGVRGEELATCTADELLVHGVIWRAEDMFVHDGEDPDWIKDLPARPDLDDNYSFLEDVLLQDDDVLLLFNPALDGIESLDPSGAILPDTANLHPRDWFQTFHGMTDWR